MTVSPYEPNAITPEKAAEIGASFARAGKIIPLVGAYFNPVHSDGDKAARGRDIFADYLRHCCAMGCGVVGSETGSYSDDPWVYHPRNRTEEALQKVVSVFSQLCDVAADCGSTVAMEGAEGHVCWDVDTLARARRMIGRKTRVIFDLYNYMDADNQRNYLDILDRGLDVFAGGDPAVSHEGLQFHPRPEAPTGPPGDRRAGHEGHPHADQGL